MKNLFVVFLLSQINCIVAAGITRSPIISSPLRSNLLKQSSPLPSNANGDLEIARRRQNSRKQSITNVPNLMSIARMAAIPVFLGLRIADKRSLSEGLFVVSSLSDYVDGWIARRYNMTSNFGAFIDPVADKLSVTAALLSLMRNIPTWWFTIPVTIMISRELFVSGLREWMATRGLRSQVKVGSIGKWKTAFQMLSLILLLHSSYLLPPLALTSPFLFQQHQQHIFSSGVLFLYISAFLSLLSAGQYLHAAWPILKSS